MRLQMGRRKVCYSKKIYLIGKNNIKKYNTALQKACLYGMLLCG